MLKKGVYPNEYIDDWEMINETSLPEKEDFYCHLNAEGIGDADYKHAKRVKYLKIEILKQIILVNTRIFMFKVIHYC